MGFWGFGVLGFWGEWGDWGEWDDFRNLMNTLSQPNTRREHESSVNRLYECKPVKKELAVKII